MPVKGVPELLSEFVKSRKAGSSRDDAWRAILQKADHLKHEQIQQLLNLAKNWEVREGNQYPSKNQDKPNSSSVIKPLAPRGEGEESTPAIKPLTPPTPTPAEEPIIPDVPAQAPRPATGELSHIKLKIAIRFNNFPNPLMLEIPGGREIILGCSSPKAAMTPDVDLSVYNGESLGIERMHAILELREQGLMITDLGTQNHTYLNGYPLKPHEMNVVNDGDRIRLANLAAEIRFMS